MDVHLKSVSNVIMRIMIISDYFRDKAVCYNNVVLMCKHVRLDVARIY